ncbi:MAG TPA: phosphatase [Cyanobacteria bacterium UBA11162]|nr:phosphatase [Cyanobacteria bacterium UBA12227]HAX88843.1 phosphatase [Cyanobacteria bacterium UBA11370]HBL10487.1 phosphatase [Cyanobacteria bacterium UBA11162]HBY76949.1 phosphatase [Cyanobacteria bacterium UBA11148]
MEDIYNFLKLSDSVATAGQPTEAQFSAIKESGYRVIVNLALPESTNALPNEQAIVESQGMQYIHIPVIWEKPTLENISRFFSVMETNADKKILVHCAANMRVSVFMYLYRLIHDGISNEKAKQDLHQIWIPNDNWQEFIQQVINHYQQQHVSNTNFTSL